MMFAKIVLEFEPLCKGVGFNGLEQFVGDTPLKIGYNAFSLLCLFSFTYDKGTSCDD